MKHSGKTHQKNRTRQNRLYTAFVISMVLHLSVATFHVDGVTNLPVVFLLIFNYIFALIGRDYSLGFRLFFFENQIERDELKPKNLFLFGTHRKEKDLIQKSQKLFSKVSSLKLKVVRYALFSLWIMINYIVIVPRIGGQYSIALSLGFMACWIILHSFQLQHFLLVFAISFVMVLISVMRFELAEPLVYVPYLLLFFTSLSFYRKIFKKPSYKNKDKRAQLSWGASFYDGINVGFLFVVVTFFMFHIVEFLENKARPKIEEVKKELSKNVSDYADKKVNEFLEHQSSNGGNRKGRYNKEEQGDLDPKVREELKKFEEMASKMTKEKKKQEIRRLVEKMEQKRKEYIDATNDYKKTNNEFSNVRRRQIQSDMDKLRQQAGELSRQVSNNEEEVQRMVAQKLADIQNEGVKFERNLEQEISGLDRESNRISSELEQIRTEFREKSKAGMSEKQKQKIVMKWNKLSRELKSLENEKVDLQDKLDGYRMARSAKKGNPSEDLRSGASEKSIERPDILGDSGEASEEDQVAEEGDLGVDTEGEAGETLASTSKQSEIQKGSSQNHTKPSHSKSQVRKDNDVSKKSWFDFKEFPKLELDFKKFITPIMGFLKIFLLLVVLFMLNHFVKLLKPREVTEGIKKQVGLSPDKKHRVKRKFQALRLNRMSPNEEVIHTYKAFLETMSMAEFPKEKWCPVTDFRWQVNQEFVDMDESVGPMTELFCKRVYGRKDITQNEIAILRKARDQFAKRMVS